MLSLTFATVFALAFGLLIESRGGAVTSFRGRGRDIGLAFLSMVLVIAVVRELFHWLDRAVSTADVGATLPAGVEFALGFLLFEFFSYGIHRLSHAVPFLWRFHRVHHEPPNLDVLVAFRQHPVEAALVGFVANLPGFLLGLSNPYLVWSLLLARTYTALLHMRPTAEPRMQTLLGIFALPAYHAAHHRGPGNYAGFLPFIDRLFGTTAA
jgi:sterol desaturase/sphingolipid hydroxylase (fatty acid hydroxylase superfamily)